MTEKRQAKINYSNRLHWDVTNNLVAGIIDDKRRTGVEIIDLTQSNPTKAGFDYHSIQSVHCMKDAGSLIYEPEAAGMAVARQAIAAYYREHDVHLDAEQVVITSSTSEAYSYIFRLLADPEDNFLAPVPCYPLFSYLADFDCAELHYYHLTYHNGSWQIDIDSLNNAIDGRTRGIILVNPNNPTGSFIKKSEVDILRELCVAANLPLIVDEVFLDYTISTDTNRFRSLAGEQELLTFVLSGLSKVVGLPQMKLSWIVLNGPDVSRKSAIANMELVTDMYMTVSTPIQFAVPEFLKKKGKIQSQIIKRIRDNYSLLQDCLAGSPAVTKNAEGGWYAVIKLPDHRSDEEWAVFILEEYNLLFHPGYLFDFQEEACLVCSLLEPESVFQQGISKLKQSVIV